MEITNLSSKLDQLSDEQVLKEFVKRFKCDGAILIYLENNCESGLARVSAADGDILRRAMSGKGRSLSALQKVRDDFFASCRQQGHPEELSKEIYRQIESFAGYSFCKAHSASYAVESYQSLYLKVYYPLEFMVSAINNMGGFYRTEVYVHEARMSGVSY